VSFIGRKRVFLATRYRGPGFEVDGVGRVRTLPELGLVLNADPTLDVVLLGNYDAEADGVFAASPLGTTAATTYTGDFDGRGHRLGGFRLVDNDPTPGIEDGLFGNVGDNSGVGRVHDLTLSVDIRQLHWERTTRDSAGRYLLGTTVGGAVASLRGTLEGVTINGRIYGSGSGGQFGGLVGRNEQWPSKAIAAVTKGNPTIIQTSTAHGIPTGQWICLKSMGGMPTLDSRQGNLIRTYTVTALTSTTFAIDFDSTGLPDYTGGGLVMGAGTVRTCKTNARVELSPYNYNSYFSILVASNRGLLEYCEDSRRAESVIPRTTVPNPPTAAYTAGWTGAASISGTTLTVTETSLGAMAVGLNIFAPNTVAGTVVAANTVVTADLGGGNWQVSGVSQTVSSRDLLAASGAPGTYLATGQWAANIAGDNGLPAVGDSPTAVVRYNKSYADLRNADNVNSANLTGGIVAYQGDGIAYGNESYGKIQGASSVAGTIGFNALSSSAHYANLSACEVIALGGNAGGNAGQDYGASNDNIAAGTVTGTTAVGTSIGLLRGTAVAARLCAFGNAVGTVGVGSLIGQALTGASLDESLCFGTATGTSKVGAIGNRGTGVTITDVYFDIDSTGSAIGVGSGESTGVSGLSDTALLAGLPSGFDSGKWSRGVITPNYPVPTAAPTPPNPTVNLNPPPSLAVVGHATSIDSTSITLPTDIQAGDYCILWNFAQNTTTTAPSLVAPSGFTLSIQQFSTATHGCRITQYVKQLSGTETTISGISTGTRGRGMIALIVRGSKATLASTWTRLNARVAIDGAAGGNAAQSMGAGTSPCIVVGCAVYDAGTPPANQISLGDDEVIEIASGITPSLVMRVSYKIKNTGAAASTFTGDTDAGGVAVTCVNVSYAP